MTRRPTSPRRPLPAISPAGLVLAAAVVAATVAVHAPALAAETWNGLTVAPEHRCSPYDRADYPYSRSVEREIVAAMGGRVYGLYTGRHFRSMSETDIEHIVALFRSPRQRPLRRRPGHPPALCVRFAQSHPRDAGSEPLRWSREVRP